MTANTPVSEWLPQHEQQLVELCYKYSGINNKMVKEFLGYGYKYSRKDINARVRRLQTQRKNSNPYELNERRVDAVRLVNSATSNAVSTSEDSMASTDSTVTITNNSPSNITHDTSNGDNPLFSPADVPLSNTFNVPTSSINSSPSKSGSSPSYSFLNTDTSTIADTSSHVSNSFQNDIDETEVYSNSETDLLPHTSKKRRIIEDEDEILNTSNATITNTSNISHTNVSTSDNVLHYSSSYSNDVGFGNSSNINKSRYVLEDESDYDSVNSSAVVTDDRI